MGNEDQSTTSSIQPVPPTLPLQKPFTIVLTIITILSITLTVWFYYQNTMLNQQIANAEQIIPTQPNPTQIVSPELENKPLFKLPVVIFQGPLANDTYKTQRKEIQQKIINPFVDYYQHIGGQNYLVSLAIGLSNNDNKDQYPYLFFAIMNDGSYHSSVIMQSDAELSWWVPDCMGLCDYSDEFKINYPQIVSITNP